MITVIVLTSLAAAFFLSLMDKWGVLQWLQVHSPYEWLNELFRCRFCCSFWVLAVVSAILFFGAGDIRMLFIPFFATPLTKLLW